MPWATSRILVAASSRQRRVAGEAAQEVAGVGVGERLQPQRGDVGLGGAPAGARLHSSGRAVASTSSGVAPLRSITCSTRSSSVASAHWTSSSTRISGRRRASACSRVRIAQNASSGATRSPAGLITSAANPNAGSSSLATSASRPLVPGLGQRPPGEPVAVGQAAAGCDRGDVVQRVDDLADQARLADAGGAEDGDEPRRLLAEVRSTACSSRNRSLARPTSAARRRCGRPGARGLTLTSRNASTVARFPFSVSGAMASASTAWPTSATVSRPSSTSPAGAACSSRAATLTMSPLVYTPPSASAPVTASPVLTPILIASSTPRSRWSSSRRTPTSSRISAAARTARSASSSCATGIPNTAMTASPMYFSTIPPWRSITSRMCSDQRCIAQRSVSESTRSPSAVEPTTSAKTTVTSLRRSRTGSAPASEAPQAAQNRERAGAHSPQTRHAFTGEVSAPAPGATTGHRGDLPVAPASAASDDPRLCGLGCGWWLRV